MKHVIRRSVHSGTDDADTERVRFVYAVSRLDGDVDRDGKRLPRGLWYEVVPETKIDLVLSSIFHAEGIMSLSNQLYAHVKGRFVGITHNDCDSFIARTKLAQLARSNPQADKIIAPTVAERVGDIYSADITFLDSATIPGNGYTSFLTVIDACSRMAFTVACKDKAAATVAGALEGVVKFSKTTADAAEIPNRRQPFSNL